MGKRVPRASGPPRSLAEALAAVAVPRPYGWDPSRPPLPLVGLLQAAVAATLSVRHPGVLRWLGSTRAHHTPWPHVRQFCRLDRRRVPVHQSSPTGPASIEITYSITSLLP